MSMKQILKWNLSLLLCIFLAACSGSESDSSKTSKELETPDGHHIVEGNTGTSVLSLYFISPVSGTLNYQSFNISAAEKSDYEAIKGSIQAVKGKEYTFDVTVYGDEEIEAQESFGIKFEDASGASVSTIIGKIDNDDFPLVSVSQPEVTELDVGTVSMIFTVSLSAPVVEDYTISLTSIMPSALSSENKLKYPYVATPGQDYEEKTADLVFSENESKKEVEIVVLSENIIEEDEAVLLQLLDAGGLNVLASTYAQGTIRSDETNKVNGFQLSIKDSNRVKDIKEGTAEDASSSQWQAVRFMAQVEYPENINQDQNLEITLLSKEQALQAELLESAESTAYVDFLMGSEDICLNNKSSENDDCQLVIQHVLEPETTEFPITLYVRKDANREADQIYALSIKNDQNVDFLSLKGKVVNDDSERLQLKYNDEYLDLADFTASKNTYVLYEPRTKEEAGLRELTLKLDTVLEEEFPVTYHVRSHIQKQPGSGKDFIEKNDQELTFVKNVPSQQMIVPIMLLGDESYDGDKYIEVEFDGIDIDPLVLKIIDSNFPNVSLLQTDGNAIGKKEGTDYAPISESTEPVTGDNDYLEYWYTLKIQGAQVARSDVDYKITLEGNGDPREANDHTCVSDGHTNQKAPATVTSNTDNTDIIFGYGDPFVPIENGGLFRFKAGFAQTNWVVKVKNDKAIECLELFTVAFTPQSQNGDIDNAGDTVAVKFGIEDQDKANITIAGWQALETDVTNVQNFVITSDREVATGFDVNLLSGLNDHFACASSDLLASQDFSQSIQISPSDLSIDFPVNIKGDQTVEPSEECRLEASGYASDLINIIYQDENGVKQSDESIAYSSGLISNDDTLDILFDVAPKMEPENKNSVARSIGYVYWKNNQISPNVKDIKLEFSMMPCEQNGKDCIEATDTQQDLEIKNSSITINEAKFNDVTERYEAQLPVFILGDNVVENTEIYKLGVKNNSDSNYINTYPKNISSSILNEDKLSIVFDEIQPTPPLTKADEGAESGSRYYGISWGEHSVASTVPEIKFSLTDNQHRLPASLFGIASRKTQKNQSEYDYLLKFNGSFLAGNEVVLKPLDQTLSASGQIVLEMSLREEDLIEEEEKIEVTLSAPATDYVEAFAIKQEHTIGIDDQLSVSVSFPSNYEENVGESEEQDEISFHYTITSSGEVDDDVPELKLSVINAGSANSDSATLITGDVKDYVFTPPNAVTYENNFLTLKPALSSVINEPIQLAYKIDNDNHVEQLESIVTSIKNTDVNSAYIQLVGTDVDSPNIELTHNIINEDKTDFYIIQSDSSDTSAEEGEGDPLQPIIKTYTINWTSPIGKGVSNLEFDLPFLGTATKGSDYTLSPTDTSKLTIEEYLYSTSPDVYRERFSIIKGSESVLGIGDSVSFNIKINDDTEVEGTESILANLTEYVGMAEYISLSKTNNAITHYITSEEGLTLSLTQVSGSTESNEAARASNRYRIEWSDDIGIGVGDISLQIKFSEASSTALIATKGSDYSVTSNSNKLIIDGDTFKIKKDSDETLTKGHLDFTVRVSNNNDLVEPDETYTLEMKKITGTTPTFITVDKDNKIVSHKIIDTNKAKLSLYPYSKNPTDSGYENENGDGNEKIKLYYRLYWDKKIAGNVPDLSIKIKLGTASPVNGNATLDDVNITNYEDNDYDLTINGENIRFKGVGVELPKDGFSWFSYKIRNDDNGLVERDEDLTGSLEFISENDEAKKYISLDTTYNKLDTYTILNDDKITLSLISNTTTDLSKTEADEESLNYSLKWNAPVAADVPALSVTLDPSSSDGQATVDDYTVAPVDASKLTIANKTIYIFKAANKSLSVNDQGVGAVDFVISVENDLDVEMDEMLKATLADVNTSFVIPDGTHNSLSHKIITDGDKLPLTISRIPLAEGISDTENEDNWNTKQYQITWPANVSVSNYVSELSLNFDLSTSSEENEPIAIEDGDFTVAFAGTTRTNEKILIKDAENALSAGGTYMFSFDIINDDMVEIDERIEAEFSITGANTQYVELTNSSLDKIIHKITSEDTTTLSISPVNSALTNTTSEETEVTRTYKLSSTHPISKDVTDIKVNLSMASGVGYAQSNFDYDFSAPVLDHTGDVYTAHKQGESDTSEGQLATFSITTKTDDLVEHDEIFEATLSLNSGTGYAKIDTDTSKKTVLHTIENDDFIEIYLTDNSTIDEPIGSEPETLVDVYWSGANIDSGLPEIKYTLEVTGDIASTDYNMLNSPVIDSNANTLEANTSGLPILDVLNDRFIENNEKLNVKLKFNGSGEENDKLAQFVRFSKNGTFVNDYEYTINDSDYFEITTQSLLSQGSPSVLEETTQLLENGEYHLKLCIPVGLSIQDTEVPFDITPLLTNTFSNLGRTLKQATPDDYVFDAQAGTSIDLASGFVNGCKTQKLLTAKDKAFTVDASAAGSDTSQNTSFKMAFNTSDVRCNGSMCIDEQFVTIMNDDLVNLLDTGLNECVYSENRLFDLPCANGDIPGSYQYQDAAVTDFYPRLSYTYINENGNAVATKPADNTKMCFQDNSTGLIFSSSSELKLFNEENTVALNTCALNETGRSWQLPSVQELITIMDLNPLSTSKPLINPSILGLKKEGTNFSDAHSRYWSQDSCAINGIADGRWTVDYISGHLTCNDINDSNFFIKVYR